MGHGGNSTPIEQVRAGVLEYISQMSDSSYPMFPATSPCIKVCVIDLNGECRGCRRTLTEIGSWSGMSLNERRVVNQRIGFQGHDKIR